MRAPATTGWRLLLALALALAACGQAPDDSHFPLAGGHEWSYRIVHEGLERETGPTRHVVRTLPSRQADGEILWRRLDSLGNEYHFHAGADGVRRVAMRNAAELIAQPDVPPRTVLQYPLVPGTSWQAPTRPYAIRRMMPLGGNVTAQYSLPLTYTVESVDETVQTPAGRFAECVLVVGRGSIEIYGDARQGFITVPITHSEWYAKGVGLVKLVREEAIDTDVFRGGTIRFELVDYR